VRFDAASRAAGAGWNAGSARPGGGLLKPLLTDALRKPMLRAASKAVGA
jgi:hypothetical protein